MARFARLALAGVALALTACGDAGGYDLSPDGYVSSDAFTRTVGSAIITPTTKLVRLEVSANAWPTAKDPPCPQAGAVYLIDRAAHTVTFDGCFVTDDGAATRRSDRRTLDAAAWSGVETAMDAVVVGDASTCGQDKGGWLLTVYDEDGGAQSYDDGFYACGRPGLYSDSSSLEPLVDAMYGISGRP